METNTDLHIKGLSVFQSAQSKKKKKHLETNKPFCSSLE